MENIKRKVDARAFLDDVRKVLPQLNKYPDDILLNKVKERPDLIQPYMQFNVSDFLHKADFSFDIPKPMNFLDRVIRESQRAVRTARTMPEGDPNFMGIGPARGLSIVSKLVPTTGEEAMDYPRVIGGTAADLATYLPGVGEETEEVAKSFPGKRWWEPRTEVGERLEKGRNIALTAAAVPLIMKGVSALKPGNLVEKMTPKKLSPQKQLLETKVAQERLPAQQFAEEMALRQERAKTLDPFISKEQRAKGIKSQIIERGKGSKQALTDPFVDEIKELAYQGSKEIGSAVDAKFEAPRTKFRAISESPVEVAKGELADVIKSTLKEVEIGEGRQFLSEGETRLQKLHKSMTKKRKRKGGMSEEMMEEGELQLEEEISNLASDVKDYRDLDQFRKNIANLLGGEDHLYAKFNAKFRNLMKDKGLKDYTKILDEYKSAYDSARTIKPIMAREGSVVAQTAKGKTAPSKVSDLLKAEQESGLGTNVIERAIDVQTRVKNLAKELGMKMSEIKDFGDRNIRRLDNYLNSLGNKKREVINQFQRRADELKLKYKQQAADLGVKSNILQDKIATQKAKKELIKNVIKAIGVGGGGAVLGASVIEK